MRRIQRGTTRRKKRFDNLEGKIEAMHAEIQTIAKQTQKTEKGTRAIHDIVTAQSSVVVRQGQEGEPREEPSVVKVEEEDDALMSQGS